MADINVLKEKVQKAAETVTKRQYIIEKHQKSLEKKIKAGAEKWDIAVKQDEIEAATKKLREAKNTLENWQAKLDVEIEKERFLEGNAPQAIKDFLEKWKEKAFKWHVKRFKAYQKFAEELKEQERAARIECIKTHPEYAKCLDKNGNIDSYYKSSNPHPYKPMEAFLKERGLDYRSVKQKHADFAGHAVLKMCEFRTEAERLAWLENTLEKDKKAKMLDLIHRINQVVGTITDAAALRVGAKGQLNGIIVGDKGTAKVETIGAGGYNIQCFHYRTLVHPIK